MRVISQDMSTDYPYDKSVVFLDPYNENNVKIQLAGDKECFMLGKYSTKEKALKVMELLREAYLKFAQQQMMIAFIRFLIILRFSGFQQTMRCKYDS